MTFGDVSVARIFHWHPFEMHGERPTPGMLSHWSPQARQFADVPSCVSQPAADVQSAYPDEQVNVQVPPEHVDVPPGTAGHELASPHWPVPSQVWICEPEHWVEPGTHTPVQEPPEQTKGQVAPLCQVPVPSHVCGTLPTHFFEDGTQDPVQAPEAQT